MTSRLKIDVGQGRREEVQVAQREGARVQRGHLARGGADAFAEAHLARGGLLQRAEKR
mgnify:CR=1 FL=1